MSAPTQLALATTTHDELVQRSCRWLAGKKRCVLVFAEPGGWSLSEFPDALGFLASAKASHVVECKVSRADFRADAKKGYREKSVGMGSYRWYMTPAGLVAPEELPEGCGLLHPRGRSVDVVREATKRDELDVAAERDWLFCVAQRAIEIGVPWKADEFRFETMREGDARRAFERERAGGSR